MLRKKNKLRDLESVERNRLEHSGLLSDQQDFISLV